VRGERLTVKLHEVTRIDGKGSREKRRLGEMRPSDRQKGSERGGGNERRTRSKRERRRRSRCRGWHERERREKMMKMRLEM
jgi:hypothetical protein